MKVFKRNQENKLVEKCKLNEVLDFLKNTQEIECDTETLGFDCHTSDILCIQFGNTDNQYLIHWKDSLIEILRPFFSDKNKVFIFQNAKFDLQFFYKKELFILQICK